MDRTGNRSVALATVGLVAVGSVGTGLLVERASATKPGAPLSSPVLDRTTALGSVLLPTAAPERHTATASAARVVVRRATLVTSPAAPVQVAASRPPTSAAPHRPVSAPPAPAPAPPAPPVTVPPQVPVVGPLPVTPPPAAAQLLDTVTTVVGELVGPLPGTRPAGRHLAGAPKHLSR